VKTRQKLLRSTGECDDWSSQHNTKLTKDDHVQDQDDETNNTATGAELPGVAVGTGADILGHGQGDEASLNEKVEQHVAGVCEDCFGCADKLVGWL